ncbi:MAG: ABC transporter ATP-binding protein [Alphaproteobacteria bacterium]
MSRFKKLWKLLELEQKKYAVILFLFIVLGTLMEIVGLGLVVPLVSLMSSPDALDEQLSWLPLPEIFSGYTHEQLVFTILGLMVLIYTVKTGFLTLLAWMQASFNLKTQADLSKKMLHSYLNRSHLSFQQDHSTSYVQNVNNETQILIQQGFGAAIEIIMNALLLIIAAIVLLMIEPIATLIVLCAISIAFWLFQALSKIRVYHWGKIRKEHESLRLKTLQQALFSAKEIKLKNKSDFFINNFHQHSLNLIHSGRWQSTFRKIPKYFFELLAIIGLVAAIIYMILDGKELSQITPVIALFAAVFIKIMPSVNAILTGLHSMRYIDGTISLIYNELSQSTNETPEQGHLNTQNIHNIAFDDISFSYSKNGPHILKNIQLEFPHGSSIGIIGSSGAGKSTLIDIFLGLLRPDEGTVKVNEQDIQSCLRQWQNRIGYVPQSIYLLDDTLRRNIAFGENDEEIIEENVLHAIKDAQLETFVNKLPDGLNTVIGEDGGYISGGEKQRIALARALYHKPDILVLDEATSSLDMTTEKNIMNAVYALRGQRTIFIVTHRLSTVEKCDILLEIEDGRIKSVQQQRAI